ncbi:CopD family protein [Paraburkholderia hayleyella]|uniref:CopD family protein n=1 Tax=Paraburkholderia hayleyella TaxID=2152889 RepID=UPI00129234C9|nr:CopD family protein [Paraburkholderia hayleyella]
MRLDGLWLGQVAMAALMNVAFAFVVGSALLGAWLASDARAAVAPGRAAWLRAQRSMLTAAIVLLLADLGWLLYQSAAMGGVRLPAAFALLPVVLLQTYVGYAWSVAFGGALLLLLSVLLGPGGGARHALFGVGALAVAAGKAALGHAADDGLVSVTLAVHALHVLSTSVWGGLVLAAGFAVLPALGESVARGVLIRTSLKLSHASLVALAFVLVSGAFNLERGTGGSLEAIQSTLWGHVLLLKLALVALALGLGGLNRYLVLPRLRRTASTMDARTFVNVLHLEALMMLAVFITAAVLAHSVPALAAAG